MRSTNLVALAIAVTAVGASAATFPDAGSWQPVAINGPDGGVVYLGDPLGDGANNGRDIVGDDTRPAFYISSNATHFFFRLRLSTDPTGPGGLGSYGWGILIDTDGEVRDYDYVLMADGVDESIKYSKKTTKTLASDPSELADTLLNSAPTVYSGASQNVSITTIPAGATGFGGNDDYFLDLATPLSTLYGANPDGGATLNFSPSTVMRFWVGISNSSRAITLDLGGTSSSPGPGTMIGIGTVPQQLCQVDSECGSTTSGMVCNNGACITGCRGTGGNGCPSGSTCSSATSTIGTCSTPTAAPVITAPTNGSFTSNKTPALSGTSVANATINVTVDGVLVGTTTANASGAWAYTTATLSEGVHTASATATVGGSTSESSNVPSFTVDSLAPAAPVVVTPANGSTTASATPTISGTAEANATVRVFLDGAQVGTTTANGSGAWSFVAPVSLADGSHAARATAVDAANNVSGNSNTNTFSVDTTAPAAPVVTTPANGSVTNNTTPTVTGTAEANSTVRVFIDGVQVGTAAANGSGAWTYTTSTLSGGSHTVRATAVDAVGNVSSNSNTNTFTIDTTAPAAPVVTAPANGARSANQTPAYSGTAEANSTVRVFIDGVQVGSTTTNSSGAWSFTQPTSLAEGSHTVSVTATDAAGNTSVSANTNTFTVDVTPPGAPVVVTPANGSSTNTQTPAVTGTAEAGSTVAVFVDGAQVGTTTANGSGTWTFTTSTLAAGSHTVRATATDAAGNTSVNSNTNTFTVDVTAPGAPVVTTPANGARIANPAPAYTGTAEAGSTVRVFVDGAQVGTATANGSGAWTFTQPSNLAEGSHTVSTTATDAAGNTSVSSNTNTFTVDLTPPAAPVVVTPANGSSTGDNTPTISGTAEASSTIAVFIDGAQVGTTTTNGSGAWTLDAPTALADGSHTTRVTATDAAGNTSVNSNTNTFTVDTSAPGAPVVVTPANGSVSNNQTPSVTGTAEASSTVRVFVDGVQVGTTTANGSGNWTFTSGALAEGSHTVSATATDAAGNTSVSSNTNAFVIDVTPPAAPVVIAPANGSSTSDNTPTITGTAEANSTVRVFLDGAQVGSTTANGSGAWTFDAPVSLLDGTHTARATATDAAGNTSPNSNTNGFTVDTTAPAAPSVLAPANGSITGDDTPAVSGTAEANSTVRVFIDGVQVGTTTANSSGAWSYTSATLTDGPHTVRATATDVVGNTSSNSSTNSFTVDTGAPVAPVVTGPANGSLSSDATPDYAGTAEALSTITVYVDGSSVGTATANAAGAWSLPAPLSLTDGPHTVRVTATDSSGNVSPTSNTNTFTIDTTAPVAPVVSSPSNGGLVSTRTPTITGTAEANSTVTLFVDGNALGTATADASGAWSFPVPVTLADGEHAVRATSTDAAGNVSPTSNTNSFTIDSTAPGAPVVTAPTDGSITSDPRPAITGTAEANSTVRVFIDGVLAGTITASSTGAWTFTPATLADGQHTVKATAMDAAGNVSADSNSASFEVDTAAPTAPVVTAPANNSTTTDATPTITGTSAAAGLTITIRIDGTVAGVAISGTNGDWTFTASTLSLGAHSVSATATDSASNVSANSASNDFTVLPFAPPAPTLTAPVEGSVLTHRTPAFTGTAEPGSTVTVRVDGNIVCTATATAQGEFSCTPAQPLREGAHVATASATNGGGSSPESSPKSFEIDVTAPLTPSVIGPAQGSTTTDITPAVTGTGEPGSLVTVSIDGQRAGDATVGADGTWTFDVPTALALGAHQVSARASDASGNVSLPSNTNGFTIVAPSTTRPTLDGPADNASLSQSRPTFTGTSVPGATVTVLVDGQAACTATAANDGSWSCTPAQPLPVGPHQAVAETTDGTSGTSSFSIDTSAPLAPVVTGPSNGSSTTDTTPVLEGNAEALSVVKVFVDGVLIGSTNADVNGRWTMDSWPLTLGTHSVTATSTDRAGNVSPQSTASQFTVVAPNGAPTVLVPQAGTATPDSTPLISGTGTPGASIEVLVDGTVVCSATATASGAWSCAPTTPLSEGPHSVVAREQGSTNGSIPVPFTIDSIAPSAPVVISPTPNQYTSPTPTLEGTAEPGARVEVSVDGMAVCVTLADGAGAWRCVPPSALADGTHTVTAKATDVATNESLPSQPVTFQVDRTPPTAPVITEPAEGSSLTDTTPTFTGAAEPGSTVTVRVNGMAVCTATASAQGAWSCDPMAALPRGTHVATATATDPAGNTSMPADSRSFTVVAETPPAPAITGPASGTVTSDSTPRVTGTATPGSTVTVRDAGSMTVLCTATADAQGNWSCDSAVLTDGTHGLVATAEKDGATSTPSSETTLRVDTTPPDVNVEGTPPEPIPSSTGTTFTWAIESETTYECSIDGGAFQECTAPFNVPGLAPGEHTITVRATDAAGNVNETSTTWLVSDPAHVWDVTGGGLSCAAVPAESFAVLTLLLAMRRRRS